jgi:hypothetical protein
VSKLGVKISDRLAFTPVDFEHQTVTHGLAGAGFEFDRPALFTWIGVTMYLTLDASRPRWPPSLCVRRAPRWRSPTTSPIMASTALLWR